jgi:hypothetical protein
MSEKENIKPVEEETKKATSHKKEVKRYTGENKKESTKQNESQTGPHAPRGKKQRRNFKLYPNRG